MCFWEERERRTSAPSHIVSMSPPSYPSAWLHPCRARFCFTWRCHFNSSRSRRRLVSALFPLLARFFQFAIPRRKDLGLAPRQYIRWRDKSDGAVKAHGVVVVHVLLDEFQRVLFRQRRSRPDALSFERFV